MRRSAVTELIRGVIAREEEKVGDTKRGRVVHSDLIHAKGEGARNHCSEVAVVIVHYLQSHWCFACNNHECCVMHMRAALVSCVRCVALRCVALRCVCVCYDDEC